MKWSSEDIYDRSRVNKFILAEIINLFVIKEKQTRFLEFIESPKRYNDFLHELLNDPRNLKPECIIELPGNQQTFEIFVKKLRNLGARKRVYLVSNDDEIDGNTGSLEEILSTIIGLSRDSIIYCLNSRVGYYQGHEGWRYILHAV